MGNGIDGREPSPVTATPVWLLGVGLAYFFAHQMAFLFPDSAQVLMALWPPAGVGLAALLLSPRRLWPALIAILFIGGNLANIVVGRPILASLGFMLSNVLESLGCAYLIVRSSGGRPTFSRVREVVALVGAAVFVNAATALIGAGTASLGSTAAFWSFWKTWWIADGLGILLVTPAIVTWAPSVDRPARLRWPVAVEASVFLAFWCALTWYTFNPGALAAPLSPYLLVAFLAWPALRLGLRGTTLALVVLAAITVASASIWQNPLLWGPGDATHRLLLAQLFLWVVTVAGLFLAASYAQARSAERRAREEHLRFRAIEDNLPDVLVYQVMREHDGSMRFLHISAGIERLHGISAESVLRDPKNFYDLILEEDRPLLVNLVTRAKRLSDAPPPSSDGFPQRPARPWCANCAPTAASRGSS
jgi:integral membrane sensor domain MASE1